MKQEMNRRVVVDLQFSFEMEDIPQRFIAKQFKDVVSKAIKDIVDDDLTDAVLDYFHYDFYDDAQHIMSESKRSAWKYWIDSYPVVMSADHLSIEVE